MLDIIENIQNNLFFDKIHTTKCLHLLNNTFNIVIYTQYHFGFGFIFNRKRLKFPSGPALILHAKG